MPMKGRSLLLSALCLTLGACTTLYSKEHEWKLPGGLGNYTLSARMDISFLTRQITISVNNREILYGESYLWSDTVDMSGSLDGFPITASCDKNAKTCDVSIASIHAATLSF
jgi:hypothetical protein